MNDSRSHILARVSQALKGGPAALPNHKPSCSTPDAEQDPETLLAEFIQRWEGVGGKTYQAHSAAELEKIFIEIVNPADESKVVIGSSAFEMVPDLKERLEKCGFTISPNDKSEAARAAAGITGVDFAIAYGGGLAVSDHLTGNLTASLVPPVHIALVAPDQVVSNVEQALEKMERSGLPRAVSFIAGPSRTADIELNLVVGVHGPRETHAIVMRF